MGAGLFLLRLSVVGSLLALTVLSPNARNWLDFSAILAGVGLLAGVWARVLAGLTLTTLFFSQLSGLAALHTVDVLVLVLTGPGAWSVDAMLFGRRMVTLPDRDDPTANDTTSGDPIV